MRISDQSEDEGIPPTHIYPVDASAWMLAIDIVRSPPSDLVQINPLESYNALALRPFRFQTRVAPLPPMCTYTSHSTWGPFCSIRALPGYVY